MRLRKRRPNQVSLDEPIETDDDFIPQQIEDWGTQPGTAFRADRNAGYLARRH